MPCLRGRIVALAALVLALAPCPGRAGAAARPRPIEREYVPLEHAADSLARLSVPGAHAWADSIGRLATARGDRALEAAVLLWRGQRYASHEQEIERGLPFLDQAQAAAQAMRDTFALATVHYERGFGLQLAGRRDAAIAEFQQGIRYARAAGLGRLEGNAHRSLGFMAKEAGQYARANRELAAAVRLLPPSSFEHLHARLTQGEMLNRLGHPDAARDTFVSVLAEARRRNNRWTIAAALHDLGNVEFEQGDMAAADRNWERAAAMYDTLVTRGIIDRSSAISARTNRAHALTVLGRLDEARGLLDQQLVEAGKVDDPDARIGVLYEMGVQLHHAGRLDQAERTLRSVRAAAAAHDAMTEEATTIELSALLRESGRPRDAERLIDSLLVPARRARMTTVNVGAALLERAAARRQQGRHSEAIGPASEGERITRAGGEKNAIYWLDAIVELARCQRALGRPDQAVASLARGARTWERWRGGISNLEWRERAGSGLAGLFSEYGLALLDGRRAVPESRRAREAFDALQAFQARTLEERMQGQGLAARAMAGRVRADSLRSRVLAPGEALLDLVATPDTTIAFVVTPAGVTARLLPGTRRLDTLFADWREAMLAGAPAPVVEGGLARLSGELLGPLAAPLRASRRLVVSGGGPIMLWPIGALTIPGEPAALGATRDVAVTPSATLFALLRARAASTGGAPTLLAVGRTTNAAGRAMPGAEREIETLEQAYAGVTLRPNRGDRTVRELTADLGRWDALHFAAHAEAEAGSPWRSGFLLGRGDGEDAYLRASTVARMRLHSRLAVLSGCQSAGATALAGEGALGLSSGFLCAGTSTVVATLWPVEDRVAERFMSSFYAALSRGVTAAAAAREARLALQARPGTANPRDWAAFVVVGEPGTRLPLRARVAPPPVRRS